MNTLYFVRVEPMNTPKGMLFQNVVFLFTANSIEEAKEKGLSCINPQYRAQFNPNCHAEPVCQTPDIVDYFEPV